MGALPESKPRCTANEICWRNLLWHKAVLCASEIMVVGHRCTYEGRKPETDRVGVIMRWGPCEELGDVRSFLGTVGVHRMFIKDYAKKADALTKLMCLKVPFEFGEDQKESMQMLKDALRDSPSLMPIDYKLDRCYSRSRYFIPRNRIPHLSSRPR